MPRTPRWRSRSATRTRRAGRRQPGADSHGSRTGRAGSGGVHGATLARAQWRSRSRRSSRTRALKNGLAGHRTSGRGTIRDRLSWFRRRRFVHRTRPRLGHNHPRSGRTRRRRGSGRPGRGNLRRAGRRRTRRRRRRNWFLCHGRRRRSRGRCRRRCRNRCRRRGWRSNRLHWRRGHNHSRRSRARRRRRGGRRRLRFRSDRRWWRHRPSFLRGTRRRSRRSGRSNWPRWRRRSRRCRLLLLPNDRLQHVSRLRDVRKINLGPDLVWCAIASASSWPARGVSLAGSAEVDPHFFRFVVFERAGMSFLLGDADFGEYIENGFALDFQFPGQIVDSNLTHPPLCSSEPSR